MKLRIGSRQLEVEKIGDGLYATAYLHRKSNTVYLRTGEQGARQRNKMIELQRKLRSPYLPKLKKINTTTPDPVPSSNYWYKMPYYSPVESGCARLYCDDVCEDKPNYRKLPRKLRTALRKVKEVMKREDFGDDISKRNCSQDDRGYLILRDPWS